MTDKISKFEKIRDEFKKRSTELYRRSTIEIQVKIDHLQYVDKTVEQLKGIKKDIKREEKREYKLFLKLVKRARKFYYKRFMMDWSV